MYQHQRNIPHVGRRLNRRNKLERNVGQANECDDGSGNVVPKLVSREDAANEEVDCGILVSWGFVLPSSSSPLYSCSSSFLDRVGRGLLHVQTPRPIKLNMKEAYLAT